MNPNNDSTKLPDPSNDINAASAARKKRVPPYAQLPGSLGSLSGYAGDQESAPVVTLPKSIELTSRQKKRYAIIEFKPLYPDGKKPKPTPDELQYMAHNALQDIEKGNLSTNNKRRPHVFPPQSKVDMSRVKLMSSTKFDELRNARSLSSMENQEVSLYQQFTQLASEVAHYYCKPEPNDLRLQDFKEGVEIAARLQNDGTGMNHQQQDTPSSTSTTDNSDSSSSATSSFTESDGDDGERSMGKNLSASSLSFSNPEVKAENADARGDDNPQTRANSMMPLEKALGFSVEPKYVPYALVTAIQAQHCFCCLLQAGGSFYGASSHYSRQRGLSTICGQCQLGGKIIGPRIAE